MNHSANVVVTSRRTPFSSISSPAVVRGLLSQSCGCDRSNGGRGFSTCPSCQLCGRQGHVAPKCYHRFDPSFQGSSSYSISPHQALFASPTTSHDTPWFLDSDTSHYVTHDSGSLSTKGKCHGNQSLLGCNGYHLSISHIDSITFKFDDISSPLLFNIVLVVPSIKKNYSVFFNYLKITHFVLSFFVDGCLV